jgi:uncharacterized protein
MTERAVGHLPDDDPQADRLKAAIRAGDLETLAHLLQEHPELAAMRIGSDDESRSTLHVATDWPGQFPSVAESIRLLAAAGADVNARFVGSHTETPLHWAASSDDVAAVDALLDAGADIDAPGAVLGGGSPLADACGFGQWNAARRLVERGALTRLTDVAALGMMDRVAAQYEAERPATTEITKALWSAVNGGQRAAAEFLIDRGGDVNWIGWDGMTCLDLAMSNGNEVLADWLMSRRAKLASEIASPGAQGTRNA